ncbi:Stk1 family PASTA domain-containing Ser/Thr kinase [Lapidilactobacillus bayanensis]|uniref:Stk1 family PASTA domain-containing Ser/Thr kinase n=1 Tax=Lapidilactobacillus bayanensis TaxID=2485998 RepID=UPI000F79288F|nr:Stk1 family PASTA domain-containing Ser/Thr kinase [Lapidilactobacillus bayanensis]
MMDRGYLVSGRYEILDTLGEGGMANVYLAEDTILHRRVAVKVLRLDLQHDQATIRRFQREAKATCELSHPNIVSVYDVGEDNGVQYIVMEYIDGSNLKSYIEQHYPFPLTKVVAIMTQILSAVQLAHSKGIIHRDLKPQNILMTKDGQAKIADFGIAVALSDKSVTQTNSLLGSVHYISPEQARGSLPTPQSDIYALGIILFELLTGKVPFAGDSAVSIALKHFHEDMPSVRATDAEIPQAMENVVLKATAKDPKQRYQSAAVMAADLRTSLNADRADETKFMSTVNPDILGATRIMPETFAKTNQRKESVVKAETKEPQKPTPEPVLQPAKTPKRARQRRWPLIAGVAAILLLLVGFFIALMVTNRDVNVPNMAGMTQSEAEDALVKNDLQLGKIAYETNAKVNKGLVVRSLPAEKSSIKNGTKVDLVLSRGAKTYRVVNYHDQSYETVAAALAKQGFIVKRQEKSSRTIDEGHIIKQSIKANKRVVPKDTEITLTVSSGLPKVRVGDYTGDLYNTAYAKLTAKGFSVQRKDASSDSVASGTVMTQDLDADEKAVPSETTVTLTVSTGKADVTLVDLVKKYTEDSAKDYAQSNNLILSIEKDYSDDVDKGLVMKQSPAAGSKVQPESTLTVTISQGKDPNKVTSFSKEITIPYQASADTSSSSNTGSNSSSSSTAANKIEVYIGDAENNIGSVYKTMSITHDTKITVNFKVKTDQTAKIKITRDGEEILNEDMTAD